MWLNGSFYFPVRQLAANLWAIQARCSQSEPSVLTSSHAQGYIWTKGESDEGYRTPALLEENLAGENAEECKGRLAVTIFLPIHCSFDTACRPFSVEGAHNMKTSVAFSPSLANRTCRVLYSDKKDYALEN
jgi:hypothetical protein